MVALVKQETTAQIKRKILCIFRSERTIEHEREISRLLGKLILYRRARALDIGIPAVALLEEDDVTRWVVCLAAWMPCHRANFWFDGLNLFQLLIQ